jgi:signal transduction histidine kinase
VRVTNPLPEARPGGPLAATGSGHGLTGLRERAALAGGTLTADRPTGSGKYACAFPA